MIQFKLYNTESREKERISSRNGEPLRMYTCGPTIYHFAHIGNFRTYVFEDILRRALKRFGFQVEQAMNLTDIDDKTIRGAIAANLSLKEFVEPFRVAFFEDIKTLNIEPVEYYPRATEYIDEMIEMIQTLLEKKLAYQSSDGSIYFAIRNFPRYGKLSHFSLSELEINASGENSADEYEKGNIADFALWKAYDPKRDGTIFWESPFGRGRPGWHIECSVMATHLLGPSIDLHCGGVDNMFPHHENEIAQSEGCFGCQFVRHWVHVEHLLVNHKKMSKSLGNFYTLRDLLNRGYNGSEVRYLLLSSHYRTQLNFTLEGLEMARCSLQRVSDFIVRLRAIQKLEDEKVVLELIKKADDSFKAALADDMNISVALGALFDLIREVNSLADQDKVSTHDAELILDLLASWDQVLAVLPLNQELSIPEAVFELLKLRDQARKEKNFELSDQIRKTIYEQGYIIEDTPTGARIKKG